MLPLYLEFSLIINHSFLSFAFLDRILRITRISYLLTLWWKVKRVRCWVFRPLKRQVINFVDLESQKGFVYLSFLAPFSRYPFLPLMGSISSFLYVPENTLLFLSAPVSSFIHLSFSFSLLISVHPSIFSSAASPSIGTASGSSAQIW